MSKELINSHYYLISVAFIMIAFAIFYFCYEKKKPQAREIVTLAVLCAIAVAARTAFVMIPFFKPMTAIVMISGMAFGPGAGFLVGSMSAFVSNFIFGQGPWTPWQMFAYAIAGMLAGLLCKKRIMNEEKKIRTGLIGCGIVQLVVGPLLDTCSIFTMGQTIEKEFVLAIYGSGILPNLVHGIATFVTLIILCKPMMEKLERMKIKYGMMSEASYEVR